MWLNIFTLYSLGCVLLPCLLCQLVLVIWGKRQGRRCSILHFIWTYLFMLYLWMVFQVTGMGILDEILHRPEASLLRGNVNLIPFTEVGIGYLLNIVMCMPLGFLLPLIWKGYRNVGKAVLTGVLLSVTIEISQLFNLRATDVDDVIANTLGTLIGYLVWKLFVRKCGQHLKTASYGTAEAVLYLVLSAAGTFFLYCPYLLWNL